MKSLTTKIGDKGTTRDFANCPISKGSWQIELVGAGNAVNIALGNLYHIKSKSNPTADLIIDISKNNQDIMQGIMGWIMGWRGKNFNSEMAVNQANEYCEKLLAVLADYKMNHWITYKGEHGFAAATVVRHFEHLFWKNVDCNNIMQPDHRRGSDDKHFDNIGVYINRLSDLLFYVGILE